MRPRRSLSCRRPYRWRHRRGLPRQTRRWPQRKRRKTLPCRRVPLHSAMQPHGRTALLARPDINRPLPQQPEEEYPKTMNGETPTNALSAVYVDTENLTAPAGGDDIDFTQDLIRLVVNQWPDDYPPIGRLALYVPADKTSQWRIWASALMSKSASQALAGAGAGRAAWREPMPPEHQEPVKVRGVQHFSRSNSKNSADMAIVLDVVDDLLLSRRADFAAVLSNDSDFYALFDKLQEIVTERGHPVSEVPLLWIVAPNGKNLSPEIKRFLLPHFVWDLSDKSSRVSPAASTRSEPDGISQSVLDGLVHQMEPSQHYRASDLHAICKSRYPVEPVSKIDTAVFGSYLKNSAPALSDLGVQVISASGTSRYVRK